MYCYCSVVLCMICHDIIDDFWQIGQHKIACGKCALTLNWVCAHCPFARIRHTLHFSTNYSFNNFELHRIVIVFPANSSMLWFSCLCVCVLASTEPTKSCSFYERGRDNLIEIWRTMPTILAVVNRIEVLIDSKWQFTIIHTRTHRLPNIDVWPFRIGNMIQNWAYIGRSGLCKGIMSIGFSAVNMCNTLFYHERVRGERDGSTLGNFIPRPVKQ